MAGKEDDACERRELLPVDSAVPTCPKLAARHSCSLATALPCSSQPSRLEGSRRSQAEGMSQWVQHPLHRLPTGRAAGTVVTHSGTDLSWLPILPWPRLYELFSPPLAPRPLTNLSPSITAESTHTLSRHHCTLFIHPRETGLSFFYLLVSTFLSK